MQACRIEHDPAIERGGIAVRTPEAARDQGPACLHGIACLALIRDRDESGARRPEASPASQRNGPPAVRKVQGVLLAGGHGERHAQANAIRTCQLSGSVAEIGALRCRYCSAIATCSC